MIEKSEYVSKYVFQERGVTVSELKRVAGGGGGGAGALPGGGALAEETAAAGAKKIAPPAGPHTSPKG